MSKCIEHGLYRNISTNSVEGSFGNLKSKLKHKAVHLYELFETIKEMSIDAMTRSYSIEIPKKFIDQSNIIYRKLTPLAKIIISEQIILIEEDKIKRNSYNCLSCKIRGATDGLNQYSYPCCHQLLELYGRNIYIDLNDLPSICFKGENSVLTDCDFSKHDIINPPNIKILNGIGYVKKFKNKNDNARKNVDKRRKRIKNICCNQLVSNP